MPHISTSHKHNLARIRSHSEPVVFPCGVTVTDDGDSLHMYYGGADSSIALATASIRELLGWLHAYGQAPLAG